MNNFNLLAFGTDSYKQPHHRFYPPGLEYLMSYGEARKGGMFKEITWFGLQNIISKYLTGQVVTREKIEEAAAICGQHFGRDDVFNREGWEYILNNHGGQLPIRIKALAEGMVVPEGTCLFTIENTDPQVPWLVNFLETMIMQVWNPTTVATGSREVKKIIARYLAKTGTPALLPFKLHDFGFRGVSSLETAEISGAAHLVNFMGTDTMCALNMVDKVYGEPMAGFSIPATEHSIMTAGGPEGEADIVRQILKAYPTGLVAIVIDSYDTLGFINNVIGSNRDIVELIKNRPPVNGMPSSVVFRPDSGELPDVDFAVFYALESVFGSTVNEKGYRVLHDNVRIIQGDGIEWYATPGGVVQHTVGDILEAFEKRGLSADNIAFGSGGGLLQKWNRDTQRFAIKCCWMQVDGEGRDIFKRPATDPAKNSKRGRLAVVNYMGSVQTILEDEIKFYKSGDLLNTVFEDGEMELSNTFAEIRERAEL